MKVDRKFWASLKPDQLAEFFQFFGRVIGDFRTKSLVLIIHQSQLGGQKQFAGFTIVSDVKLNKQLILQMINGMPEVSNNDLGAENT